MQNPIYTIFQKNMREEGPVNMCFFGDSITHGWFEGGVCDGRAVYHNLLHEMLCDEYPGLPVNILNAGRGGDNTFDALERLERDVLCHHPDITVIYLGTNDLWLESLLPFKANLLTIISRLQDIGSSIIMITGTHMAKKVREGLAPDMAEIAARIAEVQHSGKTAETFSIVRDLANENGFSLVDVYAYFTELEEKGVDTDVYLANGINHPTKEIHRYIAEKLYEICRKPQ